MAVRPDDNAAPGCKNFVSLGQALTDGACDVKYYSVLIVFKQSRTENSRSSRWETSIFTPGDGRDVNNGENNRYRSAFHTANPGTGLETMALETGSSMFLVTCRAETPTAQQLKHRAVTTIWNTGALTE